MCAVHINVEAGWRLFTLHGVNAAHIFAQPIGNENDKDVTLIEHITHDRRKMKI